jgi:hypothetical protein
MNPSAPCIKNPLVIFAKVQYIRVITLFLMISFETVVRLMTWFGTSWCLWRTSCWELSWCRIFEVSFHFSCSRIPWALLVLLRLLWHRWTVIGTYISCAELGSAGICQIRRFEASYQVGAGEIDPKILSHESEGPHEKLPRQSSSWCELGSIVVSHSMSAVGCRSWIFGLSNCWTPWLLIDVDFWNWCWRVTSAVFSISWYSLSTLQISPWNYSTHSQMMIYVAFFLSYQWMCWLSWSQPEIILFAPKWIYFIILIHLYNIKLN